MSKPESTTWRSAGVRLLALFACGLLALGSSARTEAAGAYVIDINGGIGAASADILKTGMEQAIAQDADVIVLRLDTPGGLDNAMRDMVQRILISPIPVVTWVGPAGARAASAGTYLLLASHVAVMHPTSTMGAATPVSIGGDNVTDDQPAANPGQGSPGEAVAEKALEWAQRNRDSKEDASGDDAASDSAPEDGATGNNTADEQETPGGAADSESQPRNPSAMGRKIINDAVAYIRSLAERHGRNADWAERAVRDGATLTASEALEQNVVDALASNIPEMLAAIDGRQVTLDDGREVTLATTGMSVEVIEPSWRQKLLSVISDPSIAVLLVLVGIYGLWFEGFNPGAVIPGVIGAICLLLAAYALQVMPVNYVGLGLILLGVGLMIAELFVPSFGALGLGGIVAFVVGAIMAFDTGVPGFEISRWSIGAIAAVSGGLTFATMVFARRLHTRGAVTGDEGMRKHTAVAIDDFDGDGYVWLESERWHAVSDGPVKAGEELQVTAVDGLTVSVAPKQ